MMKHLGRYTQAWGPLADLPPGTYDDCGLDFGSTPVFLPTHKPPPPPPPPPGSLSIALELPGAISFPDEVLDDDWDW